MKHYRDIIKHGMPCEARRNATGYTQNEPIAYKVAVTQAAA